MEGFENSIPVFTPSLLSYYFTLLDAGQYILLKENFYYNFEMFILSGNYESRVDAIEHFICMLGEIFGNEIANNFIEALDIEQNFRFAPKPCSELGNAA